MTFIKTEGGNLVALAMRWEAGDKFAFIEAIAYCAARDWKYPDWVISQINSAMTHIFTSVYPDIDLRKTTPSYGTAYRPDAPKEEDLQEEFEKASKKAAKNLCLKVDRDNIIATRKRAIRDLNLAEMVAQLSEFEPTPIAQFRNVTAVQKELKKALKLSPHDFGKKVRKNEVLVSITKKTKSKKKEEPRKLWAKYVPLECLRATHDMIRDAWEIHRKMLIAYEVQQHQARYPEEPIDN